VDHPGTPILRKFDRVEKARFQRLYQHPELRTDDDFPLTMVTGRSLYHWHTKTSGRVDDRIVNDDYVLVNPMDAEVLAIADGADVWRSVRGTVP
jgi:anaerobic selenocysteine-containing dehydrogenase